LLFVGAGPALDRCDGGAKALAWTERGARGQGPLEVGAAKVPLVPSFPVTLGGYGPPRAEVSRAVAPLFARAVVLSRGQVRIGLVNADVLLIPEAVALEVRARAVSFGLTDVMVVATHAHTSLGGYDARLVSEVAALGRFHPEARRALVAALVQALEDAASRVVPASLATAEVEVPKLVRSRDAGQAPDPRLTRVSFTGANGPLAQLILFSAHPTTAGRAPKGVDPDYPGRLAGAQEASGAGVTLFLPSAVGNGSAGVGGGPEKFARAVAQALPPAPPPGLPGATLSLDRARFTLPHPDASRLVPFGLKRLTEDVLCQSAPSRPAVEVLELGGLTLVGVPGEATFEAARALEQAVGPTARVVSLADGYVGYLETDAHVRAGSGEAKRQYFGPELLDRLVQALRTR
jgi:hypothetical protein